MSEALVIETMIKHLPPSASTLQLLDVTGKVGESLKQRRADLVVTAGVVAFENSTDAVVVYEIALNDDLLSFALRALRPGGRLIAVDPAGEANAGRVKTLEGAGYTRILVEELSEAGGVLMRGEKPHVTEDTVARIQSVAERDEVQPEFKGRYVHLLIRQTPNKPVWALKPGEVVEWQAVAIEKDSELVLLAFSSLPNAVAFMQPAVIAGNIQDVNKVAKFAREAAQSLRVLINPPIEILQQYPIVFVPVDPSRAETPDE